MAKTDRTQYLRGIASSAPERVPTENDIYEVLRKTFDAICDPTDWKAPVHAVVSRDGTVSVGLYADAIEFMTGTKPMLFVVDESHIRIVSEGYRLGPAGP